MAKWGRFIDHMLDLVILVYLLTMTVHAGWQLLTDAPVAPSWAWAFWAFAAASRITMRDIRKWAEK